MTCHELLAALNDYLDGETQSALCQQLQGHLADCSTCRVVVDNLRFTITVFRASDAIPIPPGLHRRIRSKMRQQWAGERNRQQSTIILNDSSSKFGLRRVNDARR